MVCKSPGKYRETFPFIDQDHGKPENSISAQVIFHGLLFHNFIYHYAVAFQTGMHSVWMSARLSFYICTFLTDITGLCGKDKGFIAFLLQISAYLSGQILMSPPGREHFFHIQDI